MKPLIKVEMKNLPLSIPAPWMDFFDDHAAILGVSRNAVFRLALKFGGPVLARLCEVARDRLRESLESPAWASEIVETPAFPPDRVVLAEDDGRESSPTNRRGRTEKPAGRKEIYRGADGQEASAGRSTGKGNAGRPGPTPGLDAGKRRRT